MPRRLVPFPASLEIVDKLKAKHDIEWEEIEEVFRNYPRLFLSTIADQYGESRYDTLGRTDAGFQPVGHRLGERQDAISSCSQGSPTPKAYGFLCLFLLTGQSH